MLRGHRVLDLCDERGYVAGQILAALGADVITIEPLGGSPARRLGPFAHGIEDGEHSLAWWSYARDKRSAVLELESAAGREHLLALARDASFLLESGGPGAMEALGLGWEVLSEVNPGLIMVSVTAFGLSGPKASWPAADLTAWAASGALLVTGDAGLPPVQIGIPQAFFHAGADAAVGALVAHEARLRDGLGQRVDVSAQASAMASLQSWVLPAGWGDAETHRIGAGFKLGPLEMRFVYPCADGFVSITFLFGNALGPFTRRLMEWMCDEGFIDAATRDKDWVGYAALLLGGSEPMNELQRVMDEIERFCRAHTKSELFAGAAARRVLLVPVNTTADVVASVQLQARGYWQRVPQPGVPGGVLAPGPFARFGDWTPPSPRPAPAIGEHTAEVLGEEPLARAWPAPRTLPGAAEPPLAGLKILDFSWAVAGPAATRALADYGATVVRVESTTRLDSARTFQPYRDGTAGPERSACYADMNAGKLGVTLNLTSPGGREVALALAAWADVVVENYSPGTMAGLGLGYETLRAVNPGLIMVSSSLHGQDGPWGQVAGFGTLGSALAGFHGLTGWPERPPAGPFLAYTDYMTPRYTACAILACLEHRRATGRGQLVDLSQMEAALHFLSPALLDFTVNGHVQERAGNSSDNLVPHGVYPCTGEDRWVAIAAADDRQWQSLCAAIGREGWTRDGQLATLAGRRRARQALDAGLAEWTAPRTAEEIEAALVPAGVAVHRVSSSADLMADPQLEARGHFPIVDHPVVGRVPLEGARFLLERTPPPPLRPHPTFGEHNAYVLSELLGWPEEKIAALAASGVLE